MLDNLLLCDKIQYILSSSPPCKLGVLAKKCIRLGDGDSDTTVVIDNSGWLKLIIATCGNVVTYFNEEGYSSMVRLRPGVSQYKFLKVEQRASQGEIMNAREELVDKLNRDVHLVFPTGNQSMIGFASAGGLIDIVEIASYDSARFGTRLLQSFNVMSKF